MNEQQHAIAERITRECEAADLPLTIAIERAFQEGLNHRTMVKPRVKIAHVSLTRQQRNLLDYIMAYRKAHKGVVPSYEEMCAGIGVRSKSGIHRLIKALEERGHITRLPDRARAIQIIRHAA